MLGDHLVYEAVEAETVPAPDGIAFTLGLRPGAHVYHLERLAVADGMRRRAREGGGVHPRR